MGYGPRFGLADDYDLFLKVLRTPKMVELSVQYDYRVRSGNVSRPIRPSMLTY